MIPVTRYAERDGVDLAYKVFGEGDRDIVLVFAFISNVDVFCELPEHLEFIERLRALDARVILYDKRGTGLSDRVPGTGSIESDADDLVTVLDAVGSRRAALIGWFDGGATALVAAARHPDRIEAVVAFEVLAAGRPDADFPWAIDPAWAGSLLRGVGSEAWGRGVLARELWPGRADRRFTAWWERYESMSATPSAARALLERMQALDVRPYLASVRARVLVLHDPALTAVDESAIRWLADQVPGARLQLVGSNEGIPPILPTPALVDEIEEFLTGARSGGRREVLAVVFTDIVGSTAELARSGDERWRNLLAAHGRSLGRAIERYAGTEANTTGDGLVATFPLPSSALRFASDAIEAAAALGLSIRVGVHAGELVVRDGDLIGLVVHTAARVCALAPAEGILVTDTVRGMLLGFPFVFEPAGEHELKGVPDRWRLWRCVAGGSELDDPEPVPGPGAESAG
ncbi:alpha/beta fold hydrolase [Agromyces arachidis]|uniref:alpha/beta fold hydrolase n=1 Tax=Agromyces arachidis TaxID=766966 RepID=UPI0040579339